MSILTDSFAEPWRWDAQISLPTLTSRFERTGARVQVHENILGGLFRENRARFTVTIDGVIDNTKAERGIRFFDLLYRSEALVKQRAAYQVVDTRVVLFCIDGLGARWFRDALKPNASAALARMFATDENGTPTTGVVADAVCSLPSITWCNWASVLTGLETRDHGVYGNSFFRRDMPELAPVFSGNDDGHHDTLQHVLATSVGLAGPSSVLVNLENPIHFGNYLRPGVQTIFERIAGLYPDSSTASILTWYGRGATAHRTYTRVLGENAVEGTTTEYRLGPGASIGQLQELRDGAREALPLVPRYGAAANALLVGVETWQALQLLKGHDRKGVSARFIDTFSINEVVKLWQQGIGRMEVYWDVGTKTWELKESVVGVGDIPTFTAVYLPGPDNVGHADGHHVASTPEDRVRLEEGNYRPFSHFIGHTADEIARFDAVVREQGMEHATVYLFTSDHGQTVTANERADEVALDPDHDGVYPPYQGSIHGRYVVDGHPDGTEEEPFRVNQLLQVFDSVEGLQGQLFLSDEATDQLSSVVGVSTQHLRRSIIFSPNGGMAYIYVRRPDAPGEENQDPNAWRTPDFASIRNLAVMLVRASQDGTIINYPEFTGALGNPPVVLVRENSEIRNAPNSHEYKWLRIIEDEPVLASISELSADQPHWEMLEKRLQQLDDKDRAGGVVNTRCGDIILIMNTADGFNAVHEGDAYPGWHGGPSKADSNVPFAVAYPGIQLNDWMQAMPQTLVGADGILRNRHMTAAVMKILGEVRR